MPKSLKANNYEQNKKSLIHNLNSSSDSESEINPKVVGLIEESDRADKGYNYLSNIRKHNTPLLSEQNHKYKGEIARRESSDYFDNSTTSIRNLNVEFQHGYTDTSLDIDDSVSSKEKAVNVKDIVPNLNTNLEVHKALCVQNQLTIWEKLLEARIHFQKILNKANNLPYSNEFQHSTSSQETKQNLEGLLEKLLETKVTLSAQFSDIRNLDIKRSMKKTRNGNTKEYGIINKSNFDKFKPYRNSVLLKWEDRTKLLMYNAVKTRGTLEKSNIVKNIDEHLLRLNDLITHTRAIKAYNRPPEKQPNAAETNLTQQGISHVQIYDDTDFYHSQLRELIEYKTNSSTNSYELNTQFSELQKLRQKMKKRVDTRASKGRKIRYMIHNKLINYMGSKNNSNWTEESKSELYKSLFFT